MAFSVWSLPAPLAPSARRSGAPAPGANALEDQDDVIVDDLDIADRQIRASVAIILRRAIPRAMLFSLGTARQSLDIGRTID